MTSNRSPLARTSSRGRVTVGDCIITERAYDARKTRMPIAAKRVCEVEALIRHRHGSCVDTEDWQPYARVAFASLRGLGRDARVCAAWAAKWLPDAAEHEVLAVIADASPNGQARKFTATTAGNILRLSADERKALRIVTMRGLGQTAETLAEDRRLAKLASDTARRRKDGAIPRSQYEAQALANCEPWEALGISRRTWYRRGKPMAQVSADYNSDHSYNARTCANYEQANEEKLISPGLSTERQASRRDEKATEAQAESLANRIERPAENGLKILRAKADTAFVAMLDRAIAAGTEFGYEMEEALRSRLYEIHDLYSGEEGLGGPTAGRAYRLIETEWQAHG